jgi:aromatic ring hydroxylase
MMTFERDGEGASYRFLAPRNAEQLVLKRRNIEFWSQATFGQMGRFPEFIAELVVVCWIGRTSSKSTTNNGPRMPEPTIVMSAATTFA